MARDARTTGQETRAGRLGRDLLIPYILLLLSAYQMHGYLLLQRLAEVGLDLVDPTTIYRTLRAMERDGLIWSRWETGSDGPARRVYGLTASGARMLDSWAGALDAYQRTLSSFFDLYAGLSRATLDAFAGRDAAREDEEPTEKGRDRDE